MRKRREFQEIAVTDSEKLQILSKSWLCRGMDRTEVQALAPFFQTYHLETGRDIYQEGDTEAFLCLLASGSAKVYKDYDTPSEKVISVVEAGETVGEMAVIDEQPRSASVVASTEAVLYAITRRNLQELFNKSQMLWSKLIYNIAITLCVRLRQTNALLSDAIGKGYAPALPQSKGKDDDAASKQP